MRELLTDKQMKACDRYTIEQMGVPSMVLMERAALSCVEYMQDQGFDLRKCLVVCGTGNNGGDGAAIARLLHLKGYKCCVFPAGNPEKRSEELKIQLKIAENYGVSVVKDFRRDEYTTIVDAVFGIGLGREITGEYRGLIERMNQSTARILSVDIPSGIHGDTGRIMGTAVKASDTVTFAYGKPGLYLYPGAGYAGNIHTADIGIYLRDRTAEYFVLDKSDLSVINFRRRPESNKGTFGKVFLTAGAAGMSGAALMAAKACFRTGTGMVRLHTDYENKAAVQSYLPEVMTSFGTEQDINLNEMENGLKWCDAAAIGPGLGTGSQARIMVQHFLESCIKPCIIDADALNIISEDLQMLRKHKSLCVITPHMGEMARLTGTAVSKLKADPVNHASRFAKEFQVVCVLKDARTVIAFPDGRIFINISGNAGMATAGCGDILTGILAGLLGQANAGGFPLMEDIPRGAFLHGAAGDAAAEKYGSASLMATDLLEMLPKLLKQTS